MDTWWIDEPYLLGSSNPTDTLLETLKKEGFQIIISFLHEDEQPINYTIARAIALGYIRHNIPVTDYAAPTVYQLEHFVSLVDNRPPSAKLIAHCQGGIGRTGTFAAAYWISQGLAAQAAIAQVRQARPKAVETQEQEEVLVAFEQHLAIG